MPGSDVPASRVEADPRLGVFDTLLVRGGRPVDLQAHVSRLCASVVELYAAPVDPAGLAARITADAEGFGWARLRTSYDPGAGVWDVEATSIDEPGLDPRRLTVRRLPSGWGGHKWVDRRGLVEPGTAGDVLLVDGADRVLEAGSATVFAALGSEVVTPQLDGRILPGTVRARVLELLRDDGRPVSERDLTVDELGDASEVFTTSSIRGVQPVVGCDAIGSWEVGPTTMWLRARISEAAV